MTNDGLNQNRTQRDFFRETVEATYFLAWRIYKKKKKTCITYILTVCLKKKKSTVEVSRNTFIVRKIKYVLIVIMECFDISV